MRTGVIIGKYAKLQLRITQKLKGIEKNSYYIVIHFKYTPKYQKKAIVKIQLFKFSSKFDEFNYI